MRLKVGHTFCKLKTEIRTTSDAGILVRAPDTFFLPFGERPIPGVIAEWRFSQDTVEHLLLFLIALFRLCRGTKEFGPLNFSIQLQTLEPHLLNTDQVGFFGLEKRAESNIHSLALEELGQSLDAEITPRVIELEDRTVRLTGNVEDQYDQWRELLADIYAAELAALEPPAPPADSLPAALESQDS